MLCMGAVSVSVCVSYVYKHGRIVYALACIPSSGCARMSVYIAVHRSGMHVPWFMRSGRSDSVCLQTSSISVKCLCACHGPELNSVCPTFCFYPR